MRTATQRRPHRPPILSPRVSRVVTGLALVGALVAVTTSLWPVGLALAMPAAFVLIIRIDEKAAPLLARLRSRAHRAGVEGGQGLDDSGFDGHLDVGGHDGPSCDHGGTDGCDAGSH